MRLIFGSVISCAIVASAAARAGDVLQDCLFSQAGTDAAEAKCDADPLHLRQRGSIVEATRALGIEAAQIDFVGCEEGRFKTTASALRKHAYKITYKLAAGYSADDYVLPLVHELAHVFQIERYGSMGKLKDAASMPRIELGADFIAGLLYKRKLDGRSPTAFDASLELLGNYEKDQPDSHGRPEDRTGAFRFGFFFHGASAGDVWGAYQAFQDELYPTLTEM